MTSRSSVRARPRSTTASGEREASTPTCSTSSTTRGAHAAEEDEAIRVGARRVRRRAAHARCGSRSRRLRPRARAFVTLESLDRLATQPGGRGLSRHRRRPSRSSRPTTPAIPVVAHVPHASTVIPDDDRAAILLDDTALARELVRMTDWHTDRLFSWAVDRGATALVHQRSRLVVDPERFADPAAEPMEALGQGAVYTRTSDGPPADPRPVDAGADHHDAVRALPPGALGAGRGAARPVGPLHHPRLPLVRPAPLPSEVDQSPDRPDICIGTDPLHTPRLR